MVSKKKSKGFAPKEAQETFAGAVGKARQPVESELPHRPAHPAETLIEPDMKSGKRKNNRENPFVKK